MRAHRTLFNLILRIGHKRIGVALLDRDYLKVLSRSVVNRREFHAVKEGFVEDDCQKGSTPWRSRLSKG